MNAPALSAERIKQIDNYENPDKRGGGAFEGVNIMHRLKWIERTMLPDKN